MKMSADLKRVAWAEAARWLDAGCDAFDLPARLSEEEQELVRGYIRSNIAGKVCRLNAEERKP